MKPVQAASRSKAQAPGTPSSFWTRQATDGKGPSGELVATMIMSRSAALMPASSSAAWAALVASSNVVVPGSATWRILIPVRWVIHSSEVSSPSPIKSVLVRTCSGACTPMPKMALRRPLVANERSGTASERIRGAVWMAIGSGLGPDVLRLQELPEVADHLHLLELLFGQLDVVLVLDGRDQLDQVERVGRQVTLEGNLHLDPLGIHAKDLAGQLLQLFEIEFLRHFHLLVGVRPPDHERCVVPA